MTDASSALKKERTVVLIKPDGVKRGIVGEILGRFEKAGLKVVAMKMVHVDRDLVAKHYTDKEEFLRGMGEKTLKTYKEYGYDSNEEIGTMDSLAIGKMVRAWNMDFITSGPVVAVVLEGIHAVDNVRMMVGNTLPRFAEPGSIRGDYSIDSPLLANMQKRAVRNLIHASGTADEAQYEIQLWFKEEELHEYKRSDEDTMFN